jgi:hypothetical protein
MAIASDEALMSTLKEYATIGAWILAYALIVVLSLPIMGLVVSQSWNWFLAPIAGLRSISLTEGIGLVMFLTVVGSFVALPFRKWENDNKPDDSLNMIAFRGLSKVVGLVVVGPLAGLAGAWVWHTFIISPPGY